MMTLREALRRFVLVAVALAISAALLRPQLAASLVIRGDDLNYRGNVERARAMYARAMWVDADDTSAVDRYAFTALLSHRAPLLRAGVAAASAFLGAHPNDPAILMDRGLLDQTLHRYAEAQADFATVAALKHDVTAYTFAGFNALHAHQRGRARGFFLRAIALDPSFVPARRGLMRT